MAQQIPDAPVQEGSRWRHRKPSGDEVAHWFGSVPLDEGMEHADYVSGIVVIPAGEKVKTPKADGHGTEERYEQTFTPYVRVDTRVTYFRKLAELRDLIAVIEPVFVPQIKEGAFKNDNMPHGFWWHIAGETASAVRSLCCTMRVALYDKETWTLAELPGAPGDATKVRPIRPLREGVATKQVTGAPDPNGLAKAETGAIGRALGVAGILVIGTGIATADDMAEVREAQQPVALPAAGAGEETEEQLNERLSTLEARLRPYADAWREFAAWWSERSKASGWSKVNDAPIEARRGVATKIEGILAEQPPEPPPRLDSIPAEETGSDVSGGDTSY